MKVGFTGTRKGMNSKQILALQEVLEELAPEDNIMMDEFHHGDCEGADEQADNIAWQYFNHVVIHPPIDVKYRAYLGYEPDYTGFYKILKPKEYLERNKDIVDAVDVLIFAPETKEEELRSGTWSTVRYARKKGKRVIGLEP